jgi:hypothetical protein
MVSVPIMLWIRSYSTLIVHIDAKEILDDSRNTWISFHSSDTAWSKRTNIAISILETQSLKAECYRLYLWRIVRVVMM